MKFIETEDELYKAIGLLNKAVDDIREIRRKFS